MVVLQILTIKKDEEMTNADFMGSSGSFAQGLMNGLSLDFDGDFDPTQYNSNTNSQDRKNDILHLRNNADKANKVPEDKRDYRKINPLDDYYINKDGSIRTVKTNDKFDKFYIQDDKNYNLIAKLDKNNAGLVQFPENGVGFSRFGTSDEGGISTNPKETVGQGDHYLQPVVAAALFGLTNELNESELNISLGDMSSSNGSDPWQLGFIHHKGHGHNDKRSGLDVDFRYLSTECCSFQSKNAFGSSSFSPSYNKILYDKAAKFGFTRNYQGTKGNLKNIKKAGGHNDHGHLGFNYEDIDWKYILLPPKTKFNWLKK